MEGKNSRAGENRPCFYIDEHAARSVIFHQPQFFTQSSLRFFFLAFLFNARLFVKLALFHFPKQSFLLKLAFEDANSLFNIVVNDIYFQKNSPRFPVDFFNFVMLTKHERKYSIFKQEKISRDKL